MTRRMDEMYPEDKGCTEATEHLGYQSKCTECPLPECKEVRPERKPISPKHLQILALSKGQMSTARIAKKVGVHHRTVQRIVSMGK